MNRFDYDSLSALTVEQRAELKTFDEQPPPHVVKAFKAMREERSGLPEPAAPEPESFDTAVKRLAKLPDHEYDKVRKSEAKYHDVQLKTLDSARAKERGVEDTTPGAGRALDIQPPDLWPNPVNGPALLTDLTKIVVRYLTLPAGAATALSLWALHTHCFDVFGITPRLAITSPEKRCGKTTLLRVLNTLVCKPLTAANISSAAMFRTIELARPTLLVDEADTFLHDNEELRGVVNSGHGHDGNVIRICGDDHEPRMFSTFAPVAIACIGHVPATIADRSIEIKMRRRKPDEMIERFRREEITGLADLARKCARWVDDNRGTLATAKPEVPGELHDRAADNWRGLLAIADIAGQGWGARARKAALLLSGLEESADAESAKVKLLSDIKTIFETSGGDKMTSFDLVGNLVAMADLRPWAEWKHGKQITAAQVARLLAPFGIAPCTIRVGPDTAKGYHRDAFYDSWSRYLGVPAVTPLQPAENCAIPGIFEPSQEANVTDRKSGSKPQETAICNGVSDENPDTQARVQDGGEL